MNATKALDRSGQGNDGTLTNGPARAKGKLGQALSFDDSNDEIQIADSTSLDTLTTNITYSAWIKRSSIGNNGGLYVSGSGGTNWYILLDSGNKMDFVDNGTDNLSTTEISDTAWHHIVVVKNGDAGVNITFYLDGMVDGKSTASNHLK